MPNSKNYKRNYRKEYDNYHGKPAQIKRRNARNAARSKMVKAGVAKKGDGKDVDHKRPLRHGGTNNDSNLRVRDKSSNRAENGKKSVKEEHGAGFEGTSSLLNKYLRQTPGQYVPKKKEKNDKNINKT